MNRERGGFLERELLAESIDAAAADTDVIVLQNLVLAIWRGLIWIVLAGLIFGVVGILGAKMLERKYTSVAQVMIDTRNAVDSTFVPVTSGSATTSTTLESELEVLRSLDLIERVVDQFGLTEDPEFASPTLGIAQFSEEERTRILREMTIAAVAKKRTIEQVGNISAVYAISFLTNDPMKSARLANALAEEYLNTSVVAKRRSLELSQGWLTERTSELQRKLTDLNIELESHIMAAPYSAEEVNTIKVQSLIKERQLRDTSLDLQRAEDALGLAAASSAEGKAQTENDKVAQEALIAQQTRVRNAIKADIEDQEASLSLLHTALARQARHSAELRRIENDIAVSEAIYRDFVSQLSRRTQQERYLDADARVISAARPALDPSEPKSVQIALVLAILAAGLTSIAIVIQEFRQKRLRTVREYEAASGLPLIGVVPEAEATETLPSAVLAGPPTISPRMMRFARKLRASIPARRDGRSNKIIAGVACSPGEGCTTSLLMLAAACAEAGERVLLVDLDFWNSPFCIDPSAVAPAGARSTRSKADRHVAAHTDWGQLSLLPAIARSDSQGAPLTVEDLAARLDRLLESYDRILVDTAPLLQRMDVAALSGGCDAVLVFARWKTTTIREIKSMLKLLADVGVRPTAIVATRVNTSQLKQFGEGSLYFPVAEKQPETA